MLKIRRLQERFFQETSIKLKEPVDLHRAILRYDPPVSSLPSSSLLAIPSKPIGSNFNNTINNFILCIFDILKIEVAFTTPNRQFIFYFLCYTAYIDHSIHICVDKYVAQCLLRSIAKVASFKLIGRKSSALGSHELSYFPTLPVAG
jgi:hypothetical protein